jgi:hypothetical protein
MSMQGLLRRGLVAFVLAMLLTASFACLGAPTAASALVRITGTSTSPYYVTKNVSPRRVTVRFRLSARARVTVIVRSSSGVLTKRLLSGTSLSAGPHLTIWYLKTSSGAWAANGKYTINISATDSGGHAASPNPARVYAYVDNTAPSGAVTGVSPAAISWTLGEKSTITYKLSDNLTTAKLKATVEVLTPGGTVVRSMVRTGVTQGTGKQSVWDGRGDGGLYVSPGAYSTRVRIQDLAGNVYVSPVAFSTSVYVNGWSRSRAVDASAYPVSKLMLRSDTRGDLTHVVWNDGTPTGSRIRYRRLDKFGNTSVAPEVVATATYDLTTDPTRGIPDVSGDASGGAYVVWRGTGRSISYKGIWLARIGSSGRVLWSKRILSETNSDDFIDPRVSASSSGLVHVVCWKDGASSSVQYSVFRSDGNSYIGWTTLAGGIGGQCKLPNVQVDDADRVHVAWYDSRDHPGTSNVGYRELYYTRFDFGGGYLDPSATISRSRLTTTAKGYSPEAWDAPEMAAGGSGSLHITWPDKVTATSSNGIRYIQLANDGSIAVASRVALDGSSTSSGLRSGRNPAIAAVPGGGARIVCSVRPGVSAPYRLWQVNVSSSGTMSRPFSITNSGGRTVVDAQDLFASLGSDSGGVTHLVYAADTGVTVAGATQQRVIYRDLANDPAANDVLRPDLEIDAAHVVHVSSPSPPKQNTSVTVQVEVRNAGWAPSLGGTAMLTFEGAPVASVPIPALTMEGTAVVSMPWKVPDDATRTPAALAVAVAPPGEATQTASTNDTASVPLRFLIPPDATKLIVEVQDETYDQFRTGAYLVPTATVTLSGVATGGVPFLSTGTAVDFRTEFATVPIGTYTLTHAKAGYIISKPATLAVTVTRDPTDRYHLITTPSNVVQCWLNRWGGITGTVRESLGTTPVAGATVTLLESGETTITSASGAYRFLKLCEGSYTVRVKKTRFERLTTDTAVSASTTTTLNVPLVATTYGYLVGHVTDEGGYPIVNDPDVLTDDPHVRVQGTGFDRTYEATEGVLDIKLPEGSYTLDFSAPGYKASNGVPVTIVAGEETDGTNELVLNVSGLTHKSSAERWLAPWTLKANWFGGGVSIGDFELESYDIIQWYGLNRFTFNGDYQRRGLEDYIVYVKPKFVGEMFEWTYFFGVDPPVAPAIFEYGQDLFEVTGKFEPPMLNSTTRWNRTGVRVDGIDIVDQRDGSVVSKIRSSWNSCEAENVDGHLYGYVTGAAQGDQAFPAYAHAVPFNQQVVRLWITVGQMTSDGGFATARFGDLSRFNQGELMNATGCNQLQLYWRPTDNYLWADPALAGYPTP